MEKIFHLQPWPPLIKTVADDLIFEIHRIAPALEVLFMGAAALGLPGKNDIDLDILCQKKDINHYKLLLVGVLGEPKAIKDDMVFWEFEKSGFEIDCILSDPKFSHVPEQKKVFELLKSNKKLLNEYRALKVACNGLIYDEYELRKKLFFKRVERL